MVFKSNERIGYTNIVKKERERENWSEVSSGVNSSIIIVVIDNNHTNILHTTSHFGHYRLQTSGYR